MVEVKVFLGAKEFTLSLLNAFFPHTWVFYKVKPQLKFSPFSLLLHYLSLVFDLGLCRSGPTSDLFLQLWFVILEELLTTLKMFLILLGPRLYPFCLVNDKACGPFYLFTLSLLYVWEQVLSLNEFKTKKLLLKRRKQKKRRKLCTFFWISWFLKKIFHFCSFTYPVSDVSS